MNNPIKIDFNGKTFWGFKSPCPEWLKNKFREAVDFICQDCKKPEEEVGILEPHRIKRGCEGGLYVVVQFGHPLCNQKMCCNKCHKRYNYSRKINY